MVEMSGSLALVVGITGRFGGAAAMALLQRGVRLRAIVRDEKAAQRRLIEQGFRPGMVELVVGNATDPGAMIAAAEGATIVVHGVNPPKYRNWRSKALPMMANAIAAAEVHGARLVFPGNLYVYDQAQAPLVDEIAPQLATTRKGAIRREMELMLRAAGHRGVRTLTIRAGDFFGPGRGDGWFGAMLKHGKHGVSAIIDPAYQGIGHSWAYAPDLGEAVARLLERDDVLATCAVFHFRGHWVEPGEMASAIAASLPGNVPIKRFPWLMVRLATPFVRLLREIAEVAWLWKVPMRLDNRQLEAVIGPEPHTPLRQAVSTAMAPIRSKLGQVSGYLAEAS